MSKDKKEFEEMLEEMLKKQFPQSSGRRDLIEPVRDFVKKTVSNYAKFFNATQESIFEALEKNRDYWAANYYQPCNFPEIEEGNVKVFETIKEAQEYFSGKKFSCPKCSRPSNDAYECSQDDCDWKSYGLFGTLGKGLDFVVKEDFLNNPKIHKIFKPIEGAL